MAPKLFITGGTGYIGGTVLDTLIKHHPEYEISALLRNIPDDFSTRYPQVRIVKGDYDSADILSQAASEADIVVHSGNSDHQPSLDALISGLLRTATASRPKFLIHLSGSGLLADWHDPTYLGKLNPKIWSDIDDIDEITSRPAGELHQHTDRLIQDTAAKHGDRLKTAIMSPPDLYGHGRGPGKTQSIYFPVFWKEIQKNGGAPFYAEGGTNSRGWLHIEDLMDLYLKVVEAAADGGNGADWGREGYYLAASQEASQVDIARHTAKILHAHGKIESPEPKQLPLDTVKNTISHRVIKDLGAYLFAANSRTQPDRATKLFGYKPKQPSLWDCLEEDLLACCQ